MRDKDIFSRRVNGGPSEEGAMSVRNKQGKDSSSRTRRLEEFYIFQLEVVTVVNDDSFYSKTRECKDRNIPALHFQQQNHRSKDKIICSSYKLFRYLYTKMDKNKGSMEPRRKGFMTPLDRHMSITKLQAGIQQRIYKLAPTFCAHVYFQWAAGEERIKGRSMPQYFSEIQSYSVSSPAKIFAECAVWARPRAN